MRQIIIATVLAFAAQSTSAEPYEATRTFRSSKLGFSFEYPANWQKQQVMSDHCIVVSREEERRRLDNVIRVAGEGWGNGVGPPRPSILIKHQSVLDENFTEYVRDTRKLYDAAYKNIAPKLTLKMRNHEDSIGPFVLTITGNTPQNATNSYSILEYHFVKNESLLVIQCNYNSTTLRYAEPIYDRIAKSVQIFTPNDDPECDGYKTVSIDGASFEYPGSWSRVIRSRDDAKDYPTVMEPDGLNKHRQQISLLFDKKTIEQYAQDAKQHASAKIVPFVSRDGTEGLTVKMKIDSMGHTDALDETQWHVIPCRKGRLAVLFCWGRSADPQEAKEPFRHAAKTFTCE